MHTVFRRLEVKFEVLFSAKFNVLWNILKTVKCWHWSFTVLEAFRGSESRESDRTEYGFGYLQW